MKILLCDDVAKCGQAGEIKEVSAGFARNFLIPKKLAVLATDANLRKWESEKKVRQVKLEKNLEAAKKAAADLEAVQLEIKANAGKEGHLFGSITNQGIAEALLAKGFSVNKKNISLDAPIKSVGEYTVSVKLNPQVTANVKVAVSASDESK